MLKQNKNLVSSPGRKTDIILLVVIFVLLVGGVVAWYKVYLQKQDLLKQLNNSRELLGVQAILPTNLSAEFDSGLFSNKIYQSLEMSSVLPVEVGERGRENPFAVE